MSSRLHIGTDVFDRPDSANYAQVVELLVTAFQDNKATTVQVMVGGKPLLLVINPGRIPYIALDEEGTWIGFHSG